MYVFLVCQILEIGVFADSVRGSQVQRILSAVLI